MFFVHSILSNNHVRLCGILVVYRAHRYQGHTDPLHINITMRKSPPGTAAASKKKVPPHESRYLSSMHTHHNIGARSTRGHGR